VLFNSQPDAAFIRPGRSDEIPDPSGGLITAALSWSSIRRTRSRCILNIAPLSAGAGILIWMS